MNFLQCPHFDRSHEAPSVKQSRGSGLYSDVSLKHPSRDPADQMLDDTEEQPMQDDPVYANRYCIDCQSDVSQLLSEVYKPNMHVSAIQVTVVNKKPRMIFTLSACLLQVSGPSIYTAI